MLQLAATLSLFAIDGYQHSIGSDYLVGMYQSTVSKLISHVLKEMETKLYPQFIRFAPYLQGVDSEWILQQYKITGDK